MDHRARGGHRERNKLLGLRHGRWQDTGKAKMKEDVVRMRKLIYEGAQN